MFPDLRPNRVTESSLSSLFPHNLYVVDDQVKGILPLFQEHNEHFQATKLLSLLGISSFTFTLLSSHSSLKLTSRVISLEILFLTIPWNETLVSFYSINAFNRIYLILFLRISSVSSSTSISSSGETWFLYYIILPYRFEYLFIQFLRAVLNYSSNNSTLIQR